MILSSVSPWSTKRMPEPVAEVNIGPVAYDKMALITSDCGPLRSLNMKWPYSARRMDRLRGEMHIIIGRENRNRSGLEAESRAGLTSIVKGAMRQSGTCKTTTRNARSGFAAERHRSETEPCYGVSGGRGDRVPAGLSG